MYKDQNNDGVKDLGEAGVGGTTVTLGRALNRTKTTRPDGSYIFSNLPAGTYSLSETQPAAFIDGTDSIGTTGGTVGNDMLSNIAVDNRRRTRWHRQGDVFVMFVRRHRSPGRGERHWLQYSRGPRLLVQTVCSSY